MGYTTEGSIGRFWPDDTEDCFYITYGTSLGDIIRLAEKKWPGIDADAIKVDAEHIHTDCLTYDRYDPSDYTQFVVVTRIK